jgi:subtilisin family serine protease
MAATVPGLGGTLSPRLEAALLQAGPDDLVPVVVLMEAFPEQDALLSEVRGLNAEDRRRHVLETMASLAESSQAPVHALLAGRSVETRDLRVLRGINGVALEATPRLIERLAALPEVRWVLHDKGRPHPGTSRLEPFDLHPGRGAGPASSHAEGDGPTGGDTSGPNPSAGVAPGVVALGAQQVWDTLGYTGAGVIVAVVDTGIDRDHPDLADHMWTNLGEVPRNGLDDDGNGYVDDTWGWDFCLGSNDPRYGSHGTQVAGQVAGDGTNGTVTGMAPDAELMALGIDCDTPSRAFEASDYALVHGAHLITQSYSWWWTDQPDYEAFRRQTDTELAAGVLHLNSAGNHGDEQATYPIPYNISTPANCPAPWIHPDQTIVGGVSSILGVGNVSRTTDLIAFHSSRGPAAWEDIREHTDPDYPHAMPPEYRDYPHENGAHMGLIKPDLSAYGDGTTSTCPGTGYCGFSGTSSATPHVTGTAALMLEANPGATPEELAEILMSTAEHRGDPGKNNVYGTGLVQAFAAVSAVEAEVLYESHLIDDSQGGNDDGLLDPGELVVLSVTVRSRSDVPIADLEGILSTQTPGVTIHTQYAEFPELPAGGTATSEGPHFSLSIDPSACAAIAVFDLELRFAGEVRRSVFYLRVGEETVWSWLAEDFETDTGWTSDPGTTTQGAFVREDPEGVLDGQSRLTNPEDDSSPAGTLCWVTGNGELQGKKGPDNNDVDGGAATLISPLFGSPHMLSLELSYDRWYYDDDAGNSFRVEASNDAGQSWVLLEELLYGYGGWNTVPVDLLALFAPTDEMMLRFVVADSGVDDPVEGAVDEVHASGLTIDCQDHTPPAALPPHPVGDTLLLAKDPRGHALLSWQAPPVDGGHDAATLYRVGRSDDPAPPFSETGSSTVTSWVDVDALSDPGTSFYLVSAENAGGSE